MLLAHQDYLRHNGVFDEVKAQRVEHELGLIFKDKLEEIIFAGLKGTGKKRDYIRSIMEGQQDPYSVVDEVMKTYFKMGKRTEE